MSDQTKDAAQNAKPAEVEKPAKPSKEERGKMNALAAALKMSRVQVWRLRARGMPVDSADAAREWRRINVPPKHGEGKVINEVTRLRRAQADLAELDAAQKMGSLASVEDYAQATMEAMTIIGSRLTGLPGRVAGTLAGMTDPAAIRRYLTDELNAIRTSAADALTSWASSSVAARGEAPATEALPVPGPVGGSGAHPPAG